MLDPLATSTRLGGSLAAQPRHQLAHLPTPLEPLTQLTNKLRQRGPAPELWIKRDDCTGLAGGGNKTRKLEYLVADAKAQGADTLMTFGAIQSNHARQTAAACAQAGLSCELILTRQVPSLQEDYERTGNVLLDELCGAHLTLTEPESAKDAARLRQEQLKQSGRQVYRVPAGGSNEIGALGYVQCLLELWGQLQDKQLDCHYLIHASSSAGTQAGLLCGLLGLADELSAQAAAQLPKLLGVNVYHPQEQTLAQRIESLCGAVAERLAVKLPTNWQSNIQLDSSALGSGYGMPTEQTLNAIRLLAQTQGVLLDPAYSGKAFAALLAQIEQGAFANSERVVFIHTGGAMVLPAYVDALTRPNAGLAQA